MPEIEFITTSVTTSDGHEIELLATPGRHRHVVLAVHGIASNRNEDGFYSDLAERLSKKHIATALFDFRGHGSSSIPFQRATVSGMVLDLATIYRHLTNHYDRIDLVCASFGASIALLLTRALRLDRTVSVVLLNPVISYRHTFAQATTNWGREFFPQIDTADFWQLDSHVTGSDGLRLGREMLTQMALLSPELEEFKSAKYVQIIHGTSDEMVPYELSAAYVKEQSARVKLIPIENATHGFDGHEPQVLSLTVKAVAT